MSKREFTYKEKLKHLDLKRIQAMNRLVPKIDKLVGKIGITVGALILLISLVVTILRGT